LSATAPHPHCTTFVVAAVITDGERFFITQRPPTGPFANQWEFPGGKLEWGEAPEVGLQRELAEEIGLVVEVGAPLHIIHYALDERSAFAVAFYWCRMPDQSPTLIGCQDARWISSDEFDDMNFLKANRPVVRLLQSRVRLLGGAHPVFHPTDGRASAPGT
jgi:8-oxo-dGTP diphosphatase